MPASTHVPGTALPVLGTLHSGWSLQATGGQVPAHIAGRTVPATVPGSAHTDLLAAGLIPDPYLDTNEADLVWAHRTDWRWTTDFTTAPPAPGERVDLVLQGLDTVATVTLNGTVVARTANQHRSYRVDVTGLLAETNTITVDVRSALAHAEEVQALLGARPHTTDHPYNMVRKMACSFGWDWGPDFQTAGIWKPIGLERWSTARLAGVLPQVTVGDDGTGRVTVHTQIERHDDDAALTVRVNVAGPGGDPGDHTAEVTVPPGATDAVVVVEVPDVDLWWPRGYGAQPRYDLTVSLDGPGGAALGRVERRIGFRTVALDTTPDEHGTPFMLSVNGTPVCVKGANWIPDDHFLTRVDRARYARRIAQATDANLNLLRVWGGGIYETEEFYDLCDAAGVMVWQDFLFACAAYPEEEPIAGEVEAEARENVVRLVTHPALVIWNGANENMWQYFDWPKPVPDVTWGLGYYTGLLPAIVAELDPTRPYCTNSPYSPGFGIDERNPNDPDHGTHHQWDCWNSRDYAHYRDDVPRFVSEFGWQGAPTWATLTRAVPDDALHKESAAFLLHQKAEDGNGKLDRGLAPHLPIPDDFRDWHWATQLNQARAVRYAIEHYRSWWPRTAGSVVWQLNDCWPVTSWAAVDGDGRPKPLWYALRDAYADRLVTVQPRGGAWVAAAVNDTDESWAVELLARRTSLGGEVLAEARLPAVAAARAVAIVGLPAELTTPDDAATEVLVVAAPGGPRAVHLFAEDLHVAYESAPYEVGVARTTDGYRVEVTATGLVRDLALLVDELDPDARVDFGLVTLLAGETCSMEITTRAELSQDDLMPVIRTANGLVAGLRR